MAITALAPPESARGEARRRAILDVAREIFLAQGYSAASMSAIASRLGGSKGTLYNYFRSKEELFAAFMVDTCPARAVFDQLPPIDGDLRQGLIDLGQTLLSFLLSEASLSAHRIVLAEAGRFPELGRIFYETGPKRGDELLGDHLRLRMEAGQLRPGDPVEAARWFKHLVMSDLYFRRLWEVADPTPADIRQQATKAVDIFLAAFAQPPTSG